MKRLLASAVGALALGWSAGETQAQEQARQGQVLPHTVAAGHAKGGDASPTTAHSGLYSPPAGCAWDQCCGYDNGCNGGRGLSVIGGVGLYLISPAWETNPAFEVDTGVGTANRSNRQRDFRYDWDGAPEGWFGVVGECGFGARVRYWQYAQSAAETFLTPPGAVGLAISLPGPQNLGTTFTPLAGDRFNFFSDLNVLVLDFEFMQSWSPGCWELNGSAGVRYAHLSQNYTAQRFAGVGNTPFALNTQIYSLFSGTSFNGGGPTMALEGRRALGESGFALYANGRASLLFGSALQRGFQSVMAPGGAVTNTQTSQQQVDVLPVGELEIGAEFGRNVGDRARAMLQIGMVGQCWFGAGNATQGESTFTAGADGSSNLGFFGMVVRAGLSY